MGCIRIIFLVAGRIMTGLLAGIGLGLDVFGGELVTASNIDWGQIGFVSLIVIAGLTIWREIDLALRERHYAEFDVNISPEVGRVINLVVTDLTPENSYVMT